MVEVSTPDIILQAEDADGSFRCRGIIGVPAARRVWISLVSSGSATGRGYVRQLGDELEAILLSSSAEAALTPMECLTVPSNMNSADYPDRRKVLVLVGAADAKFQDLSWYQTWQSDANDSCVMTVLPPVNFEDLLVEVIRDNPAHLLRRVNGSRWNKQPSEAISGILARAEITSASTRVFISYRRLETLPIGLQLFDRLTHEGFEVFLDRFSIPPGYDFQRRLNQELEDKSMVVLIESKHLRDSNWTQHEIDFAKRNRLGMALLRMPDVEEKDLLVSATLGPRIDLQRADFKGSAKLVSNPEKSGQTMNEWPELRDDVLDRVVEEIKTAHASALFRRRHALRADLVAALNAAGVKTEYRAVGPLLVKMGKDEHLVWLTTRPPEVDDFRSVYVAHFARKAVTASSRGLIVGPQAAFEPDRLGRLQWLHTVTTCLSFDEGDLSAVVQRVRNGVWQ
jgi:hypothetical protein